MSSRIRKEDIEAFWGRAADETQGNQVKSRYQNKGPGRWDPWLSLTEGRKNAFQLRLSTPSKMKKRKVILADFLSYQEILEEFDLDLLRALFADYEVYLWPGANKPLTKPLTDLNEFLMLRAQALPVTRAKIQEGLSKLSLAVNEFDIIDSAVFRDFLKTAKEKNLGGKSNKPKTGSSHYAIQDISWKNPNALPLFLSAIDANQVKSIDFSDSEVTLEALEKIITLFPALEKINLGQYRDSYLNVLQQFHQRYPSKAKQLKLELRAKGIDSNDTIIALTHLVTYFELNDHVPKKDFNGPRENYTLEDLEIMPYNRSIVNLSQYKKLKQLKLFNHSISVKVMLPESDSLESLTLNCLPDTELDLSRYVNLKNLTITNCGRLKNIILPPHVKLETLTIQACRRLNLDFLMHPTACLHLSKLNLIDLNLEKLNLNQYPHLETLYLNLPKTAVMLSAPMIKIKNISKLVALNSSEIDWSHAFPNSNPPTFEKNWRLAKNARELSVTNLACPTSEMDIAHHPVKKIKLLQKINVPNKKATFTIKNAPFLEEVTLDYNPCETLAIVNCPNIKSLAIENHLQASVLHNISTPLDNLEELKINKINAIPPDQIKLYPRLKKFTLSNSVCNFDTLAHPLLEELTLDECNYFTKLDLSLLPNLKRLTIKSCNKCKEIIIPPGHKLEEILIRTHGNSPELSSPLHLNNLPYLRSLTYNGINLTLRDAPLLRSIDFVAESATINLDKKSKLKKLDLIAKKTVIHGLENASFLATINANKEVSAALLSAPANCQVDFDRKLLSPVDETKGASISSISPEDFLLHQQNQKNRTAHFSGDLDNPVVDARTGETATYQPGYEDKFSVTLFANKHIAPDFYRLKVIDKIHFDGKDIAFGQTKNVQPTGQPVLPLDEEYVKRVQQLVQQDDKSAAGYFKGLLIPGKMYPLPTHHPLSRKKPDFLTAFSDPADAVSLLWDDKQQQYYIQLKEAKSNQPVPVKVFYHFSLKPEYEAQPQGPLVLDEKLMPDALKQKIIDALSPIPEFAFLFDKNISHEDKLKALANYCEQFESGPLTQIPTTQLDILLACAIGEVHKETKQRHGLGSCRHRSEVFMLLSHFLGVPTRMIRGHLHRFAETPHLTPKGEIQYHHNNFGGSFMWDLTPRHMEETIFNTPAPEMKYNDVAVKTHHASPDEKKWTSLFETIFTELSQQQRLLSIQPLLDPNLSLQPVIHLKTGQTAWEVKQHILQQLKGKGVQVDENYMYIDSAQELQSLFHPYRLDPRTGKRQLVDSPLAAFLKKKGILVINWDNFTANEIATYKSILDSKPTLEGLSVSPQLKVIGITSDESTSSAVLSRCQHFECAPEFFGEVKEEKKSAKKPLEINLFEQLNWRERLFGRIIFKNGKTTIEEGILFQAIREDRPLVLNNPPPDEEFHLLLHRIRHEGKFFHNGEFVKNFPGNFSVEAPKKSYEEEKSHVELIQTDERFYTRKPIYIGLHNWHELFSKTVSGVDRKPDTQEGWLHDYQTDQQVFYITDHIPMADWQTLQAFAKKYPDKHFYFALAPGASVESIERPPEQYAEQYIPKITRSSDPDFTAMQLKEELGEQATVFHLTPDMSFSDLIYEERTEEIKGSNEVLFIQEEKPILQALQKGKKVILNGELSPTLYQQLLPWFQKQGEGELYCVMPDNKNTHHYMLGCQTEHYTFDHYRQVFPKADRAYLEKIERFYHYAERLPHQGPGRPEQPLLSFSRLKEMVAVLKASEEREESKKQHKQNPIKGLMLHDYPKGSEDYCFLNVMGKMTFKPESNKSLRVEKLKTILKSVDITSITDLMQHTWQILNCYSGKELIHLLGKDPLTNDPYPTLKPDILINLQKKLAALREEKREAPTPGVSVAPLEEKKRSHIEKRHWQYEFLMKHDNVPFIMIKGPAGVGKTHTVRELNKALEVNHYEGRKQILSFLTDKTPGKHKALLIDEASMHEPGTWDFLKGLSQNNRTVTYEGVDYPLSEQHKIIFTGNPESYPGRYYHSLFREAHTLYFSMPDDRFLENEILRPKLKNHPELAAIFLEAFNLIQKYNPLGVYSIRDLENVAQRFFAILKDKKCPGNKELALDACFGEFAGQLTSPTERLKFKTELCSQFGVKVKPEKNPIEIKTPEETLIIPPEKAYLVEAIKQDLDIRDISIKEALFEDQSPYYKQGVLTEGDPGVGKSTLYISLLEERGFRKDAKDSQSRYYHLTLSNQQTIVDILQKAFHEGAIVVLDELNLDETIEYVLNKMLVDGKDLQDKAPLKPGFMVLGSQNPNYMKGLRPLSPAMLNRFHVLSMQRHNPSELKAMASYHDIPYPQLLPEIYEKHRASNPHTVNMRTFFTALKKIKQKIAELKASAAQPVARASLKPLGGSQPVVAGERKRQVIQRR